MRGYIPACTLPSHVKEDLLREYWMDEYFGKGSLLSLRIKTANTGFVFGLGRRACCAAPDGGHELLRLRAPLVAGHAHAHRLMVSELRRGSQVRSLYVAGCRVGCVQSVDRCDFRRWYREQKRTLRRETRCLFFPHEPQITRPQCLQWCLFHQATKIKLCQLGSRRA